MTLLDVINLCSTTSPVLGCAWVGFRSGRPWQGFCLGLALGVAHFYYVRAAVGTAGRLSSHSEAETPAARIWKQRAVSFLGAASTVWVLGSTILTMLIIRRGLSFLRPP